MSAKIHKKGWTAGRVPPASLQKTDDESKSKDEKKVNGLSAVSVKQDSNKRRKESRPIKMGMLRSPS